MRQIAFRGKSITSDKENSMKQIVFRGKTVTSDDIIRAFECFDKDLRSKFRKWITYAVKYNEQVYPPKQIMRLATGLSNVGWGGRYINSYFEKLGFTIVTLDEKPVISDTPDTDISESSENTDISDDSENEEAISLKQDELENFLVYNLGQLENSLKLYEKNGITGQQYDTKSVGKIDLLAIDKNQDFVVIKLKAGEADHQACGEIQFCMSWVKENLAVSKKVRGIIIADDFTRHAVYAAKLVPDLHLKKYEIIFKFKDV